MSAGQTNRDASEIDEDALAEAYDRGLEHEAAGRLDEAADAFREVLAIDPHDRGGAAVRLAAIGRGEVPDHAPHAYVATLFDQHADVFDEILVEKLGYSVPLMVRDRLDALGLGSFPRMLDLGSGTGLTGEAMRDRADHITGVDLAEEMVAIAYEKEVYEDLFVGEAVAFLEQDTAAPYDLITATDVLPYCGGLDALFAATARRLAPGGLFAFSSETLANATFAGRSFMVGPKHRFAHAAGYVADMLTRTGFTRLHWEDIVVRHENGDPVPGHLVIARSV